VSGLKKQRGCDKPIIGNIKIEPVRQSVAVGLDVLEDDEDVPGDTRTGADVAVGAKPLQSTVGLLRGLS